MGLADPLGRSLPATVTRRLPRWGIRYAGAVEISVCLQHWSPGLQRHKGVAQWLEDSQTRACFSHPEVGKIPLPVKISELLWEGPRRCSPRLGKLLQDGTARPYEYLGSG